MITSIFSTDTPITTLRNINKDIIHDKCCYSFIVIDNSGSMRNEDGKKYYFNDKGEIIKYQYISRWEEAVDKILSIANYNISRGMVTSYYLLNPMIKIHGNKT